MNIRMHDAAIKKKHSFVSMQQWTLYMETYMHFIVASNIN